MPVTASQISLQVCSIISVICCSFVLLTLFLFPSMRRNKIFMEIVAMISLSNLLGNLPYTMAIFPKNGSPLCKYQGFSVLYFFPVSWMFTLILAYLLRGLAYYGRLRLLRHHIHIICWGIPFLFVMLRLTTNTFGVEESYSNVTVCSYGGKNVLSGFLWEAFVFCGLYFFACIAMVYMFFEVYYLQKRNVELASSVTFNIAKETLFWYPVLLIACWTPFCLYVVSNGPFPANSSNHHGTFEIVLRSLKNLCGGLTALIFFWKSKEAQSRWFSLISGIICPKFAAAQAAKAQREQDCHDNNPYPEANADIHFVEDEKEEEMPRDSKMVRNILSSRMTSATIAAAAHASGRLDLSHGALGSTSAENNLDAAECGGKDNDDHPAIPVEKSEL